MQMFRSMTVVLCVINKVFILLGNIKMCRVLLTLLFCTVEITEVLSRENRISKRSPVIDRLQTTTAAPFTTTEPLPEFCLPHNETKRNFHRPGRRLCVRKCLDYVWIMKERVKKEKNQLKCVKYYNEKYHIRREVENLSISPSGFPHMGALGFISPEGIWLFQCGSTLISEKFVVTAAHCSILWSGPVYNSVPKIVRLGSVNIYNNITKYNKLSWTDVNIFKIILHPQFKSPKKYFDIALIELEKEVTFSKILHPACLWSSDATVTEATVTGWGKDKLGADGILSLELKEAKLDIIDDQQCNDLLDSHCTRNWCKLQDTQVCAGKLDGSVDSCQGDSGGPLQVQLTQTSNSQGQMHYVYGIVSFGIGCGLPNSPGIYTKVSSFVDWIEDIVWKDEKN